ncbi:hypothetical protein MetMK1DRAFT_00004680 [Metallosphaera yellowstonensis MK1]|jgi:hypothetical protein|uniref:Nucleotidyltransferase n=1 Tax=Metallosphaera yellowstonensis MK1 TaxID=671065 RepID=H2C117_9CREN|nr:hypothetical protein [Metallosphaera yellowstonensis]EHP69966.1 hypothetical protein MetMK1DRAFT_00004680 [Metallosphaera yellowstonensis MK1]
MKFSPSIWIPVLQKFYKSLEIPVVIYGSQIIYVNLGIAFESKDIDLLIYDVYPHTVFVNAYRKAFSEENVRIEVFVKNRETIYHLFTKYGVSIEIFAPPKEESPLTLFADEILFKERDGVSYWTLSLEAYAVIQANRKEGIRDIDVSRFRLIKDQINWDKVITLGRKMNIERVKEFIKLVNSPT